MILEGGVALPGENLGDLRGAQVVTLGAGEDLRAAGEAILAVMGGGAAMVVDSACEGARRDMVSATM